MDTDILDTFKTFLPAYLTPEQKQDLYRELNSFPDNTNYFLAHGYHEQLLQGDVWHGFSVVENTASGAREVKGLVLSNSCDVAIENPADRPRRIVFAPLLRLSGYKEILLRQRPQHEVDNILLDIRRQQLTYAFYLPAYGELEESLVLLDTVHSQPLSEFVGSGARKIFTLSQYGFYIFLLKLSIHFTRFQESVPRFDS